MNCDKNTKYQLLMDYYVLLGCERHLYYNNCRKNSVNTYTASTGS
ncbi:unnamed protein product [Acanthoscelides obtectus]|uniref:Uncharacterized protein n=1 Tax=Acanthoscelides obtectus TaxID=200917 RepID=A0A9P0M9R3_ACAOB|nr:unnamed protein product [Acanthoscelides obtectus]CAK1684352.1 hypothetical protein AOBTE_LOCUS34833 [Acanthoscelides obtectus]